VQGTSWRWRGGLVGALLLVVWWRPGEAEACNRTCPAGTKRDPRGCCLEAPKPKAVKRVKSAAVLEGAAGGACYRNGTCDAGLRCDGSRCRALLEGSLGGRCYRNGTCDARLHCSGDRVCALGPEESVAERALASRGAGGGAGPAGIEFVRIEGGSFQMGSGGDTRRVSVPSFELAKTEVTVGQYRACVEAGSCSAPNTGGACNWDKPGRDDHPVNCVDWAQASTFGLWARARLPSEAEWEFAARSGGRGQVYPWGDAEATCRYAMMDDGGGDGCGLGDTTAPVCSKPSGNSAQGVCDLAGNVWEWVEDWFGPYGEAPSDGSARSRAAVYRVFRGGGWDRTAGFLRAAYRGRRRPGFRLTDLGFRLAR